MLDQKSTKTYDDTIYAESHSSRTANVFSTCFPSYGENLDHRDGLQNASFVKSNFEWWTVSRFTIMSCQSEMPPPRHLSLPFLIAGDGSYSSSSFNIASTIQLMQR